MNNIKTGELIRFLRIEKGMTQKDLADRLGLSDKTISKWERGLGAPDVSFLNDLSLVLNANIGELLQGELRINEINSGNMKRAKYHICPSCGNITVATGNSQISCCGRKVEPGKLKKAEKFQELNIEKYDDYIRVMGNHPMTKEDYIMFVALVNESEIDLVKLYPEWSLSVEFSKHKRGQLVWYSKKEGLLYQMIK